MTRLVRDRCVAYDAEHGWDLVSGEAVRLGDCDGDDVPEGPPVPSLLEVLDHGREGMPRWISVAANDVAGLVRRAATDARARGYVALSIARYRQIVHLVLDDLRDRALLLIATGDVPLALARQILLDAAARSPRPHVLLTVGTHTASEEVHHSPPRRDAQPFAAANQRATLVSYLRPATSGAHLHLVREARAAYGAASVSAPPPADVTRHLLRGARAAEFVSAGRHAAAERLLRDVAFALARRRAMTAAAETMIALGRLLLERGRPGEADTTFEEASAHATAGKHEVLACVARVWQAAARTDAGRLSSAEALLRAVLACGILTRNQLAHAEATLARVLLWQGRSDEAAALNLCVDDNREWFAGATRVRVLVAEGALFEAGLQARLLLDTARELDDPLGLVIASTAHLRVLLGMGDLSLAAERLHDIAIAASSARTPLRLIRARLLWIDALRRSGRDRAVDLERRYLVKVRDAVPPLLQRAIDERLTNGEASVSYGRARGLHELPTAVRLITVAQAEDDDAEAVRRALVLISERVQSSRVDLCSMAAGPITAVISMGQGLETRVGIRVLESGIDIGPESVDGGIELGVPVRLGSRLIAALVVRWPADRSAPPSARDLLLVASAAMAPRVDALLARAHEASRAALVVPELIGVSSIMDDVRRMVARAAAAPFNVLIEGESGVGKELAARAIHDLSPRRERRFCDVNCAALPDELLESELFGHAKGAFTGAVTDRPGLVEEADGGTLFLDEVADLSPRAQAKLLRVIQQQEVRRVGETFSRRVDVRLVSAANRDMRRETAEHRFRQDLLYRLDVIRIRIPPLRERPEDVAPLAEHFWRHAANRVGTKAVLSHSVVAALARYHWPGNVRELQNVMAALAVAAPARGVVRPSLLPAVVTSVATVTSGKLSDARAQFERRFVEVALARAGGRRSQAARELGLSRQGLLKLMERHGLSSAPTDGKPSVTCMPD